MIGGNRFAKTYLQETARDRELLKYLEFNSYIDLLNYYLNRNNIPVSIGGFAEYCGISFVEMQRLIKLGRNDKYEEMYLDWFNNFLTISRFAEHYGLNEKQALRIIDIGRTISHAKQSSRF